MTLQTNHHSAVSNTGRKNPALCEVRPVQRALFRDRFAHAIGIATLLVVLLLAYLPKVSAQSVSSGVQPGTPRTLSYQGVITNGDHPLSDGVHTITVTLYADENGTTPIWSASYSPVVTNGVFNVTLGADGSPLPEAAQLDRPIWVGTSVDGLKEMRPLSPLASSPYALNVADKSITASKMATDYVGSISVNGERVNANGGGVNLVAGDGLELSFDPGTSTIVLVSGKSTGSTNKGASAQTAIGTGGGTISTTNTCGTNTDNHVGTNGVLAGCDNSATASSGYATVAGGQSNTAASEWSTVGGGYGNDIHTNALRSGIFAGNSSNIYDVGDAIIGSGNNNDIDDAGKLVSVTSITGQEGILTGEGNTISTKANNPSWYSPSFSIDTNATRYAVIGGGAYNLNSGYLCGIFAGYSNIILGGYTCASSTVVGGQENLVGGFCSSIGGGAINTIGAINAGGGSISPANFSNIVGGAANTILGQYSTILGGHELTLGSYSLGFNANPSATTIDLSGQPNPLVYFGDDEVWLGNYSPTGGTPSVLRFYSSNSSTTYSGAIYVGLQAPNSVSTSETYYLPAAIPSSSGMLLTATASNPSTMSWTAAGTGTVTSVGLSLPGEFNVTSSPVTSTGTLTGSWANENANYVFAGPSSGSPNTPAFRSLVAADIPSLDASIITSGVLSETNGGTGHGTFTQGSVIFAGASTLSQNNNDFFWDDVNYRLGIDIGASPTVNEALEVNGNVRIDGGSNFSTLSEPSGSGSSMIYELPLPSGSPAAGQVLTVNSVTGASSPYTANLSWSNIPGSSLSGFTANELTFGEHTGAGTLEQSANLEYTSGSGLYVNNAVEIDNGNELILKNGTNSSTFIADPSGAQIDYILPQGAPHYGDVLTSITSSGPPYDLYWSPGGILSSTTPNWVVTGNVPSSLTTGDYLGTQSGSINLVLKSLGNQMAEFDGTDLNVLLGNGNTINPNTSTTQNSVIGGGSNNLISWNGSSRWGDFATIPGGDHLVANSYAQTVVGAYNVASTTGQDNMTTLTDTALFMVGNGTSSARHNAFEISYNGHATPSQVLGNSPVPVKGAYYNDNSVIAWGQVSSTGVVSHDFGVASAVWIGNICTITLNYPTGTFGAVTPVATVEDDCGAAPALIVTGKLGGSTPSCPLAFNAFHVATWNFMTGVGGLSTNATALPFFFIVAGR